MKFLSEFPNEVIEHADMGIVMSDGCRLSARVWMPVNADQKPAPVILEHLPYRKRDGTMVRDELIHPWFAGHGYVCIRTDMRGNGESEGLMDDEYTAQELQDAVEVIEWAAKQSWCNGNVGMMGISWGGFNGLQVAALAPEALKAVITLCSTVDRYADDIHYKGGCLLGENFGWSTNMLSYSSRPPDSALVGDKWREMWLYRLDNMQVSLSTWLRHQHRDAYWEHGSVCEDYSSIKAAVLSIGGWHDGYRNTISHLVENLSSPVKGIVGPWIHKYPHYAGPNPAIGFLQEAKRWWDQYLKGENTSVSDDPDYRVYLMDSVKPERWLPDRPGRWIAEQQWPAKTIDSVEYRFAANNTLQVADSHGQSNNAAGLIGCTISSPQDCGFTAGEYFPFAFGDELPADQTPDDERSLCFDGDIAAQDADIVGAPTVNLGLSCDKSNGHVTVRLLDLRPDGTSGLITFGMLNLTHRNSHQNPETMVIDEAFEASITLDQIAYRLPAGHRLRVALSTANWPTLWPSPEQATLAIQHGALSLPVRPYAKAAECTFEEPEAAPAWKKEILRKDAHSRVTETDEATGHVTTAIFCDFGENRDLDHGLISGGLMIEKWSIHPDDPLSAKVISHWQQTGGREGSMWRTEVETAMWSDSETFYFTANLIAFENEQEVFSRDYTDQVTRDLA